MIIRDSDDVFTVVTLDNSIDHRFTRDGLFEYLRRSRVWTEAQLRGLAMMRIGQSTVPVHSVRVT